MLRKRRNGCANLFTVGNGGELLAVWIQTTIIITICGIATKEESTTIKENLREVEEKSGGKLACVRHKGSLCEKKEKIRFIHDICKFSILFFLKKSMCSSAASKRFVTFNPGQPLHSLSGLCTLPSSANMRTRRLLIKVCRLTH